MDPAEPPELLHRRDLDKLNAGVAALLDERLAEDGVGVGGHIGVCTRPAFSALRSCFVPITFRLLVNRSGIQTPPWKIRAGRPTQIWIIAEITKRVNKKTRKKKIFF